MEDRRGAGDVTSLAGATLVDEDPCFDIWGERSAWPGVDGERGDAAPA
eukprot:CAMPEP_0180244798 /NCGR_PEP_ID=MMETSP0987-20121128/34631_1 /TAXON_ID=697907 /ORGANISM="non described non described, Strain CCMP2293" /LENGTH=47 /DNA_ID= /DNA_START= /DNA_END= /DNA_ORIENTATION=